MIVLMTAYQQARTDDFAALLAVGGFLAGAQWEQRRSRQVADRVGP